MNWKVITPPTDEPVTLDQVKQYIHVEWPDEDSTIQDMITYAREELENRLGRAIMQQTIQATSYLAEITQAPLSGVIVGSNGSQAYSYAIDVPQPALITMTTVEVETQISQWSVLTVTDDYIVDTDSDIAKVYLATSALAKWVVALNYPGSRPRVRFTYDAGYGATPSAVPAIIRQNILHIVAWLYVNRGASDIPDSLINHRLQIYRLT